MSTSQRTRGSETERERHMASAETVGFATTAATMLLGLVAGAEAREHASQSGDQPPPQAPPPATAPATATATATAAHSAATGYDASADTHTHSAPAAESAPIAADTALDPHTKAAGGGRVEPASPAAVEHHPTTSTDHAALHAPAPIPLADMISGLQHQDVVQQPTPLDGALANLSHIGETVSATLQQVTSTLTSDIAHLTDSLTTMTSALTSSLSALTTDGPHPGSPDLLATPIPIEMPHLDTAGAVPVTVLQVPPVQLGFIGQPTADGHDMHDGAFSALGAHHF